MSKYTTEVRFICESSAGLRVSAEFNSIDKIIATAAPIVFNFEFPIFDEAYRLPLEIKILRHYYTREICEETVGLWKLRLENRLCEMMPYFNQLYKSELIEFNPMYDVDLTTKHDTTNNGVTDGETNGESDTKNKISNATTTKNDSTQTVTDNGTSNATENKTGESTGLNMYSDTPQGALNNVEEGNYLTNATKTTNNTSDKNTTSVTTTDTRKTVNEQEVDTSSDTTNDTSVMSKETNKTTVTNTEAYLQTVIGKTPGNSYSKLLKEYRETFMNIDMMVIESLSDLFFGLWE